MFRVNLCVIATGKYGTFLPRLLDSARQYFCADFDTRLFVWTDSPLTRRSWIVPHRLRPEPWPGITIHRYRTMLAAAAELLAADYTFYLDADMIFVRPVNDEIFSDVVAVIHPGYEKTPPSELPYKARLESAACVHPRQRWRYYIGAFQGGKTRRWLPIMEQLNRMIEQDARDGIVARWHDESHWNKFLSSKPPTLTLSPDYCCYSDHRGNDRIATRKILHLVKDEKGLHQ